MEIGLASVTIDVNLLACQKKKVLVAFLQIHFQPSDFPASKHSIMSLFYQEPSTKANVAMLSSASVHSLWGFI